MQKAKIKKSAVKTVSKPAPKAARKVAPKAARKVAPKAARKAAPKAAVKKVMFRFAAPLECRVFVTGTFDGWSADEHALTHNPRSGFFQTTLALAPGRYEYKFVIDGTWVADPACPGWVPNEHGSLNSVIVV